MEILLFGIPFIIGTEEIYLILNFIATLIWWTIPSYINMCRQKYDLPPKMVIWPQEKDNFYSIGHFGIAIFTFFGTLLIIPIILGYIIYKSFRWAFHRLIKIISFSKEDKVQIALGTIEKRNPKDDDADADWDYYVC